MIFKEIGLKGVTGSESNDSDTGQRKTPLIKDHPLYLALGTTAEERQQRYRELFRMVLDEDDVHALRSVMQTSEILGGSRFKQELEQLEMESDPSEARL